MTNLNPRFFYLATTNFLTLGLLTLGLSTFGCGDDASARDAGGTDTRTVDVAADTARDTTPTDTTGTDTNPMDTGAADSAEDTPTLGDASDDVATDVAQDAAPDVPSSARCEGTLMGKACSGLDDCGADGLTCDDGLCMPPFSHFGGCGGFAGAMCMAADHPHCAYAVGADAGPCLSDAERTCACTEFRGLYACPAFK